MHGTRGIGLTLLPGLVLYDALKRRRMTGFTVIAIAAAGALLLIQRFIIGPGLSSYADQFRPTASHFGYNLLAYARSLLAFWLVRGHRIFSLPLYLVLTGLAFAGLWFHLRQGLTVVEALLAPYLLLVLLWSMSGVWRFLFPAMPFFVYLVLLGLQRVSAGWSHRQARLGLAGFLALVAFSYLLSYHDLSFGPIAETNGSLSFNALCTVVRDRTNAEDVFIYRRARALALFTSRAAATYEPGDEKDLWSNARRIHATYLVTSNQFPEDREFLIPWVQKNSAFLIPIYRNENFALYKLRAYPGKIAKSQGREAASEYSPEPALTLSQGREPWVSARPR